MGVNCFGCGSEEGSLFLSSTFAGVAAAACCTGTGRRVCLFAM